MIFQAKLRKTQVSTSIVSIEAPTLAKADELLRAACSCMQNGMTVEVDGPITWEPDSWHFNYDVINHQAEHKPTV